MTGDRLKREQSSPRTNGAWNEEGLERPSI
jgi:hypothetical protein